MNRMNKINNISLIVILFFYSFLAAQTTIEKITTNDENADLAVRVCGTEPPTIDEIIFSRIEAEQWLNENGSRDDSLLIVYVAWHVIHASNNSGNLTNAQIENQIQVMNYDFQDHNIAFILDTIDRTENDDWFEGWDPDASGMDTQGMQALNIDPAHYLNIYSAELAGAGAGFINCG
ncbi:uncharacterized protein METZ01_LOCUS378677, partial [marine metagenome]